MSYRMQAPLVDELLHELGFDPKEGIGQAMARMSSELRPSPDRDSAEPAADGEAEKGSDSETS
jgi:hypothetical protein